MSWVRVARFVRDGKRHPCRLYNIWFNVKVRCVNPKRNSYPWYGGKGVTRCAEWDDYAVFRAWAVTHGYGKGLTLDRENSHGNYEPSNCRWIPKSDQQLNGTRVKMLTVNGETKALPIWAREFGLTSDQLRTRINIGWSHERAVTTPIGAKRQRQLI